MKSVRTILILTIALFFGAAAIHSGVAGGGYRHARARTAEIVIGTVLLVGWIAGLSKPKLARTVALGVLAFGLLGTLVGLFTIAVGIGPRTTLDLTIHAVMILLLVAGLITASRAARV